jgi:hypothetical protein
MTDDTDYYKVIATQYSPLELNEFDLYVIWHSYVVYPKGERDVPETASGLPGMPKPIHP